MGGNDNRDERFPGSTYHPLPQPLEALTDYSCHTPTASVDEFAIIHLLPTCRQRMPVAHLRQFFSRETFGVPGEVFSWGPISDIDVIRPLNSQQYSVGYNTISSMGKPSVSIPARDRRERFGDSLLQGLQRSCCLRSQERLDLGPTFFDRRPGGRIRRQIE
jgi:hypothetical protein